MRLTWFHSQMLQSPDGFLHADITGTFYESDATIGYGASLGVGQGDSPETFTEVPVLMKIAPGAITTAIITATHLKSPDSHQEKKPGLSDSAAIACNGSFIPGHGAHNLDGGDGFDATHNLVYLANNRVQNNFRINYPTDAGAFYVPVRGTISNYTPGEISTETLIPFTLEITPLRRYYTGPQT